MSNPPSLDEGATGTMIPVNAAWVGSGTPQVIAEEQRIKGVEFVRPELTRRLGQYRLIEDCLEGELAVKAARQLYLPMVDAHDTSLENIERYNSMLTRAVFYNVAQVTLAGLIGQVFLVDPEVKVPALLEPVLKDANGNGVPMDQLAKAVEEQVLAKGRAGLFIDFPKVTGAVSLLDQQRGAVRPLVSYYRAENITNWRTEARNGKIELTLVVLREAHETNDDGFSADFEIQYRVLRIVNGLYEQQVWRGKDGQYDLYETVFPLDSRGQRLPSIPFTFVGSDDNTPEVALPPMYSICSLNMAHYRNSAAHEDSVFMTGQATPVVTGLTEIWVKNVLGGKIKLGSYGGIMLPEGGDAKLMQMEENTAAFQGMEHKERQMVALGAKLVEQKSVQRTATEATQDKSAEDSVLTTVTKNVSAGIRFALEWCSIFAGSTTIARDAANDNAIIYELNTDFAIVAMGPEQAKNYIDAWQKNALDFDEMRAGLDKANMTIKTAADAKAAIEKEKQDDADFEIKNSLEQPGFPGGGE
jgi:hypothetical protein